MMIRFFFSLLFELRKNVNTSHFKFSSIIFQNWILIGCGHLGEGGKQASRKTVIKYQQIILHCYMLRVWFLAVAEEGHCRLGSGVDGVYGTGHFPIRGTWGVAVTFVLREQLRVRTTCWPGKQLSQSLTFCHVFSIFVAVDLLSFCPSSYSHHLYSSFLILSYLFSWFLDPFLAHV